jgi:hypothetical protein
LNTISRNRLLLRPEARLQDIGTEAVHLVRHPAGMAHHGLESTLGKDRPPRQGYPGHALADIRVALGLGQGPERGVEAAVWRHAAKGPALLQNWLAN